MLWRYELLNTRIAHADAIILDGGMFDATDLGEARVKIGEVIDAITKNTDPAGPDTIRLVDLAGREVWRTKL
jgi:hypothetical protein